MAVRTRFGVFAFALALLVLAHSLPIRLLAQDSTTAAIIGTVTDSTKALMPGVSITLTGPALMGARTIVSDTDGSYRMPNLPPGKWVMRTAESVLLTCWPPAPEAR